MKAAYINRTGTPDEIVYGDLPDPIFNDNQVLIKTTTVCVSHIDTYIRAGQYPSPLPFPYIIGHDLCGSIVQVGKKVNHLKIGQRVWCNMGGIQGRQGTFAEYVAMDADWVFRLPDQVDEKEAIGVLQSGATACVGLIRSALLKPNETIAVIGGSGNVGSAVVQLAHARGARVITTAGDTAKMEWCKEQGADEVINYREQDVTKTIAELAPQGVDVFWDTTREPDFEKAIPLLKKRGRMVVMAGARAHPTFPVGAFYRNDCTLSGFSLFNIAPGELRGYAEIINRCLEEKVLQTKIAYLLPLKEAAKAHRLQETDKHLWGKIVLTV